MYPAGYVASVRTLPSTLMRRCMTICLTSRPLRAYLRRFRMKTMRGRQSRSLCGPGEGRGAYAPESLSRSQCDGALKRFWCFFLYERPGQLAILPPTKLRSQEDAARDHELAQ